MSVSRSAEYRHTTRQVLRWAEWYTRGIDRQVTSDRLDELTSDLYDQVMWAESNGMSPDEVVRSIRRRRLRGALDDLSWRRSQLRGARASDPIGFRVKRQDSAALVAVFAVGLAVVVFGSFALTRVLTYLAVTGDTAVTMTSGALVVSIMLATIGLVLLGWRRTRFAGSMALAISQAAVVQFGFLGLLYGSAAVNSFMYSSEMWPLAKYALVGGLGLFFAAAALFWWPSKRKAGASAPADTANGELR